MASSVEVHRHLALERLPRLAPRLLPSASPPLLFNGLLQPRHGLGGAQVSQAQRAAPLRVRAQAVADEVAVVSDGGAAAALHAEVGAVAAAADFAAVFGDFVGIGRIAYTAGLCNVVDAAFTLQFSDAVALAVVDAVVFPFADVAVTIRVLLQPRQCLSSAVLLLQVAVEVGLGEEGTGADVAEPPEKKGRVSKYV